MGAGHSHAPHPADPPSPRALAARRKANWILAAVLAPLTVLTIVAMILLWPSGSKEGLTLASPYAAAPGVTFDTGKIQRVVTGNCMDTTQGQTPAQSQQPAQPADGPSPSRRHRERARSAPSPGRNRTRAATPSRW